MGLVWGILAIAVAIVIYLIGALIYQQFVRVGDIFKPQKVVFVRETRESPFEVVIDRLANVVLILLAIVVGLLWYFGSGL